MIYAHAAYGFGAVYLEHGFEMEYKPNLRCHGIGVFRILKILFSKIFLTILTVYDDCMQMFYTFSW